MCKSDVLTRLQELSYEYAKARMHNKYPTLADFVKCKKVAQSMKIPERNIDAAVKKGINDAKNDYILDSIDIEEDE